MDTAYQDTGSKETSQRSIATETEGLEEAEEEPGSERTVEVADNMGMAN